MTKICKIIGNIIEVNRIVILPLLMITMSIMYCNFLLDMQHQKDDRDIMAIERAMSNLQEVNNMYTGDYVK